GRCPPAVPESSLDPGETTRRDPRGDWRAGFAGWPAAVGLHAPAAPEAALPGCRAGTGGDRVGPAEHPRADQAGPAESRRADRPLLRIGREYGPRRDPGHVPQLHGRLRLAADLDVHADARRRAGVELRSLVDEGRAADRVGRDHGGAALGQYARLPDEGGAGGGEGGREAGRPPGRPAALADPRDRADHDQAGEFPARDRYGPEPEQRDHLLPGQLCGDGHRRAGDDPPLRAAEADPFRPLPRCARHAGALLRDVPRGRADRHVRGDARLQRRRFRRPDAPRSRPDPGGREQRASRLRDDGASLRHRLHQGPDGGGQQDGRV
ncbi:MAG: Mannonate dehydratase, partial [uncultured Thermomicrobiales bacterium]